MVNFGQIWLNLGKCVKIWLIDVLENVSSFGGHDVCFHYLLLVHASMESLPLCEHAVSLNAAGLWREYDWM